MKIAVVALMVLFALLQIQMIAAHTIPLEMDTKESHPEVRERRSTETKVKIAEKACKTGKWVYDKYQEKKTCEESNKKNQEKVRQHLVTEVTPTKSYVKDAHKHFGHRH